MLLLSETAQKTVIFFFKFGYKFWISPYNWNQTSKQLEWSKSTKRLIFYKLIILYYTADCAFLTSVVHNITTDNSIKYAVYMKICVHWMTRSFCLIMPYFMLFGKENYSNFYNTLFYNHQKLKGILGFELDMHFMIGI